MLTLSIRLVVQNLNTTRFKTRRDNKKYKNRSSKENISSIVNNFYVKIQHVSSADSPSKGFLTAFSFLSHAPVSFRIQRFPKTNTSGRVEVLIGGVWSAVSYIGWTIEAGNVACRMHGFPNATSIPESSGSLDRLGQERLRVKHCFGNESLLVNCSLDILESSPKYSNNGEAGVICGQPKGKAFIDHQFTTQGLWHYSH